MDRALRELLKALGWGFRGINGAGIGVPHITHNVYYVKYDITFRESGMAFMPSQFTT